MCTSWRVNIVVNLEDGLGIFQMFRSLHKDRDRSVYRNKSQVYYNACIYNGVASIAVSRAAPNFISEQYQIPITRACCYKYSFALLKSP